MGWSGGLGDVEWGIALERARWMPAGVEGVRDLDLDLGADLKAHRPPGEEHNGVPDDPAYQPAEGVGEIHWGVGRAPFKGKGWVGGWGGSTPLPPPPQ